MILSKEQILLLIKKLQVKTIVAPTPDFPFAIVAESRGYEADDDGSIQLLGTLSIMLEMAQ